MRKAVNLSDTKFDISTKGGAQRFLGSYRALYKTWVMTAAGVLPGDERALMLQIEDRTALLTQIPACHPEFSASVEMLSQLRKRTTASELGKEAH